MANTYTVKWGDTLSEIAQEHGTTWQTLQKINNIPNADYIVVGQVIKLTADGSTAKPVTSEKVKIRTYGLQSGTDRGMYVTWIWDRANTKEFKVEWWELRDGNWYATVNTTTNKYSEFTAKETTTQIKVKIKPISNTYKNSSGKDVAYWTNVSWMTSDTYAFKDNPPKEPSVPKVEIPKEKPTTLIASLEGLDDLNASIIEFQLSKNEAPTGTKKKINVTGVKSAKAEFKIEIGGSYRVRARAIRGLQTSSWTAFSSLVMTVPAAPTINKCLPTADDKSIELSWTSIVTATSYKIEYATDQKYFANPADSQPYTHTTTTEQTRTCVATISDNIKAENKYYFRICAVNDVGDSEWSNVTNSNVGDGPKAPTTFSSQSSITVGELLTLNWTHNSRTETNAKYSHIDLYVDGVKKLIPTIEHDSKDDSESRHQKSYTINTTATAPDDDSNTYDIVCPHGAQIQWRVRTAGDDGLLGEWSTLRTINVYAKPDLQFYGYDLDGNRLATPFRLTSLPLKLASSVVYDTEGTEEDVPTAIDTFRQSAISYHIEIKADQSHQVVNNFGETVTVKEGDIVYAKVFDIVDRDDPNFMTFEISAGDISLANDTSYTATCTVSMDSGLTASASLTFSVVLTPVNYILDAEISIDPDIYSAIIRPYCLDSSGKTPIENKYLYVYRREYDGSFTLISGDINNTSEFSSGTSGSTVALSNTFVTDPHPALDFARYRIVAVDKTTDTTVYTDLPAYPVGCKSVIIQWAEEWSDFDVNDETPDDDLISWDGEMLKLAYNINISYKFDPDKSLVGYIGREHPVDYYGTQCGESATWSVDIDKADQETIYKLHRLAKWKGSVYVREPSGVGYWANVVVSFNKKYNDLTIPVTIEVTRVEGGA